MPRKATRSQAAPAADTGGLDLEWIDDATRPVLITEARARELAVKSGARKADVQKLLRDYCVKHKDDRRLGRPPEAAAEEGAEEGEVVEEPAPKEKAKKRKAPEPAEGRVDGHLLAAQKEHIEQLNEEALRNAETIKACKAKAEKDDALIQRFKEKCEALRGEVQQAEKKQRVEQNKRLSHAKIADHAAMNAIPSEEAYEAWKGCVSKACAEHGDKPASAVVLKFGPPIPLRDAVPPPPVADGVPDVDDDAMGRVMEAHEETEAARALVKREQAKLKREIELAKGRAIACETKVEKMRKAANAVVVASNAKVKAMEAQLAQVEAEAKVRIATAAAGIDYDAL